MFASTLFWQERLQHWKHIIKHDNLSQLTMENAYGTPVLNIKLQCNLGINFSSYQ